MVMSDVPLLRPPPKATKFDRFPVRGFDNPTLREYNFPPWHEFFHQPPGVPMLKTAEAVLEKDGHMNTGALTRDQAIERLRAAEARIRRLGVRRLALFGSVARNQATPASDVDVLVEFEPTMKTLDRFMELAFLLDEVLGHRTDLVTTEALSPYIGPHILREAEDVLRAA